MEISVFKEQNKDVDKFSEEAWKRFEKDNNTINKNHKVRV